MKHLFTSFFAALATAGLVALSIGAAPISLASSGESDAYYAFIVVDGVYKNGTGYASDIIYFPGSNAAKKYKDTEFFFKARGAFSAYLRAKHHDAFPNGVLNDDRLISFRSHSTSEHLKTRAQAEQRLTEWIAEQKDKGYSVVTTSFSFSRDNL